MIIFFLIASISATKRNRRANSENPCLIPLVIWHVLDIHPLLFVLNIGFVYKSFVHLIKLHPNLNFSRVFTRKSDSMKSNAFSKSRYSNILYLIHNIIWNYLKTWRVTYLNVFDSRMLMIKTEPSWRINAPYCYWGDRYDL